MKQLNSWIVMQLMVWLGLSRVVTPEQLKDWSDLSQTLLVWLYSCMHHLCNICCIRSDHQYNTIPEFCFILDLLIVFWVNISAGNIIPVWVVALHPLSVLIIFPFWMLTHRTDHGRFTILLVDFPSLSLFVVFSFYVLLSLGSFFFLLFLLIFQNVNNFITTNVTEHFGCNLCFLSFQLVLEMSKPQKLNWLRED